MQRITQPFWIFVASILNDYTCKLSVAIVGLVFPNSKLLYWYCPFRSKEFEFVELVGGRKKLYKRRYSPKALS